MSLPTSAVLAALGMAQATMVAPLLEDGGYGQGTAGTIAMVLLMLAQDAATSEARIAAETAAMRHLLGRDGNHAELLAALDARLAAAEAAGDTAFVGAALDLLVEKADGAFVTPPAL